MDRGKCGEKAPMSTRFSPLRAFGRWVVEALRPKGTAQERYAAFRRFLVLDEAILRRLNALHSHIFGEDPADEARLLWLAQEATRLTQRLVDSLAPLEPSLGQRLEEALRRIAAPPSPSPWPDEPPYLLPLEEAARFPERCGGKAVGLSLLKELGLPVPPGRVLTASAFGHVVRWTGLDAFIRRQLRVARAGDPDAIIRACALIQEAILDAALPPALEEAIGQAAAALGPGLLAVRSSAVAEDGEDSFAGQYASELDVLPSDLAEAVKRVYAGKYCPRAVLYRLRRGLSDVDTAMAVLILPMVAARAAGVVYTQERQEDGRLVMAIHAVAGLGARLVDGRVRPSRFLFSRTEPPVLLAAHERETTGLSLAKLEALARACQCVEDIWGYPLDIEWALGPEGLVLLQVRPLRQEEAAPPPPPLPPDAPVLAQGLDPAAPGWGWGPVFVAYGGRDFRHIPPGAVVATSSLSPALSLVMDRVAAIVAEHGSRASHLAMVARERGIPVVVGIAPQKLPSGEVVTVDGVAGRILLGRGKEAMARPEALRRWPSERWAELAAWTLQLTRLDPTSPDFTPEACQSLHDIVRVAHEGVVVAMLEVSDRRGRGLGRSRRLRLDVPFALYVVDAGQGIVPEAPARGELRLEHVACAPLRAVLDSLLAVPQAWQGEMFFADWEEHDRLAGGLISRESQLLASFAFIDADFVHLGLRLGYHFSRLDALASSRVEANYVRLTLEGGGGAAVGQHLRQAWVREVLASSGFEVVVRGERLEAMRACIPAEAVLESCRLLGRLVARLRLMDVVLTRPEEVALWVRQFLEGD